MQTTMKKVGRRLSGALEILHKIGLYLSVLATLTTFLAIVIGVGTRIFTGRSLLWPDPVSEYGLLLATVFAAPYLVRIKSHVVVDALVRVVSKSVSSIMLTAANLIASVACGVFGWFATVATIQAIELNYQDIRAISVPLVILTGPIAVCFMLMAAEFLRQAFVAKNDGE